MRGVGLREGCRRRRKGPEQGSRRQRHGGKKCMGQTIFRCGAPEYQALLLARLVRRASSVAARPLRPVIFPQNIRDFPNGPSARDHQAAPRPARLFLLTPTGAARADARRGGLAGFSRHRPLRRQRDLGLSGEGFRRRADAGRPLQGRQAGRCAAARGPASPGSPIAPVPAPRSWKFRGISRRN